MKIPFQCLRFFPSSVYFALILNIAPKAAAQEEIIKSFLTAEGYRVIVDSQGFELPTSIAFLNKPGDKPDDVLYLVAELRGSIKAVTNDRTVKEFAKLTDIYVPAEELPDVTAEHGQIGLCMTKDDSRLYSTYAAKDSRGKLINKIVRWSSPNGWKTGTIAQSLEKLFAGDHTATAHQIQNCLIDSSDRILVGVGDGKTADWSHNLDSSLGKLLAFDLDLNAHKENPFYEKDSPTSVRSHVYAYGLRNPAGVAESSLKKIYVADNGNYVDRLIDIEKGKDYPWDNSDESFTFGNLLTWHKTIGPASMIYIDNHPSLPGLQNHLIVSASFLASVFAIPLDENGRIRAKPFKLILPQKSEDKGLIVTGLALHKDGIYVSMMRTTNEKIGEKEFFVSKSNVLRIESGQSEMSAPELKSPEQLVEENGCRGCHVIDGHGGAAGPTLDTLADTLPPRLDREKLGYLEILRKVKASKSEFAIKHAKTLDEILNLEGLMNDRMRGWIEMKLENPKFDNENASMAQLNIPEPAIKKIANYIVENATRYQLKGKQPSSKESLKAFLIEHKVKARAEGFLAAVGLLGLGLLILYWLRRNKFQKNNA